MRLFYLPFLLTVATAWNVLAQDPNVAPVSPPATTPVVNGFGDGSQFTVNTQSGTSATSITNGVLTLTTDTQSLATAAFYNNRVNISEFTATFTFTYNSYSSPADGLTFTIQNDPRGPSAIGQAGGALGYGHSVDYYPPYDYYPGISYSAGFGINFYYDNPQGTFLVKDGMAPNLSGYDQLTNLYFQNGIPYTVTLTYANSQLLASIVGGYINSQNIYTLDIPFLVGSSNLAYVGFTGATGALSAAMTISDFTFSTPVPEPNTLALLGTGLGLLAFASRRKRFTHDAASISSRK